MISRSFFRQSATFLGQSLCILTDSTPLHGLDCPAPSTSAPATPPARPRKARGEEERERHGQTATTHPAPKQMDTDGQRPPCLHLHRPAQRRTPAARMICTTGHHLHQPQTGEARGEGERARREEQGKTAQSHAVKVIYTEPTPTQHQPGPPRPQPLPVPVSCSPVAPVALQFCFWRVCRTPAR